MPTIPNVKFRQLPLGRTLKPIYRYRGVRGLGDDGDGSDDIFSGITDNDLFNLNPPAPILPASTTLFNPTPNVPATDTFMNPVSVNSGTGQVSFLPQVIQGAGENPLAMTNAQAVNAGYSASDISAAVIASGGTQAEAANAAAQFTSVQAQTVQQDVLAAGGTQAQAQAAAAAATGAKSAAGILTSTGVARPSPVTVATGIPGSTGTLINPLSALQAATVIPGVPNYMLLAGVIGVALLAGGSSKRR
jgi:hypothetical protein